MRVVESAVLLFELLIAQLRNSIWLASLVKVVCPLWEERAL